MNTKICTNIEQSKKLLELGIDTETADMSYRFDFDDEVYELSTAPYIDWVVPKYGESDKFETILPAWSLTALLELMPEIGGDTPTLKKRPNETKWGCWYENWHIIKQGDDQVDAAYNMIVWLKENNKI